MTNKEKDIRNSAKCAVKESRDEGVQFADDMWEEAWGEGESVVIDEKTKWMEYPGESCEHAYITIEDLRTLRRYVRCEGVDQHKAFETIEMLTSWFKERRIYTDYEAMYDTWREAFIRGIVASYDGQYEERPL